MGDSDKFYINSGFEIAKALIASIINVFIIAIVVLALVSMAQGHVLHIGMFESNALSVGINVTLLHLLMIFLAVLMTFYPTYIFAILFDGNRKKWYCEKWGLILYKYQEKDVNAPVTHQNMSMEKVFRLVFGALIFVVWTWSMYYFYATVNLFEDAKIGYLLIFFAFGFGVFNLLKYCTREFVKKYKYVVYGATCVLFFVHLALVIVLGWCAITFISELFVAYFMMNTVVFSRIYRENSDEANLQFLNYLRNAGLLVLGIIIATNVSSLFAGFINPINHVLLMLITVYTIVILFIKALIYLRYKFKVGDINSGKFYTFLTLMFIVPIGFFINVNRGNDLHKLNLVNYNSTDNLSDFYDRYTTHYDTNCPPILYSAYGGGLMANYWNLLLLKQLDSQPIFNTNTVSFSGVSGGSMGIANFMASKYSKRNLNAVIDKVGGANILGLELSWFYGLDYIREGLPNWLVVGKDRSNRSMHFYANEIFNNPLLVADLALDSIYGSLTYDGKHFPNPIFNSTTPSNKYGVASAIADESTFPGSIQLDNLGENRELAFFEAASTSNRFPIISPAANVENVGHFLDGGYFENSAVLSNISFKKRLERLEANSPTGQKLFGEKVRLVTVRNSKESYIAFLLEKHKKKGGKTPALISNKDYTEFGAVFSGISNIERMPNYISSMAKTNFSDEYDIVEICLPYYITDEDIDDFMGGKIEDNDSFRTFVDISNVQIIKILKTEKTLINDKLYDYYYDKWGVVNPPTSRYLSLPVQIYMKLMAEHHPDVKMQLKNVLK